MGDPLPRVYRGRSARNRPVHKMTNVRCVSMSVIAMMLALEAMVIACAAVLVDNDKLMVAAPPGFSLGSRPEYRRLWFGGRSQWQQVYRFRRAVFSPRRPQNPSSSSASSAPRPLLPSSSSSPPSSSSTPPPALPSKSSASLSAKLPPSSAPPSSFSSSSSPPPLSDSAEPSLSVASVAGVSPLSPSSSLLDIVEIPIDGPQPQPARLLSSDAVAFYTLTTNATSDAAFFAERQRRPQLIISLEIHEGRCALYVLGPPQSHSVDGGFLAPGPGSATWELSTSTSANLVISEDDILEASKEEQFSLPRAKYTMAVYVEHSATCFFTLSAKFDSSTQRMERTHKEILNTMLARCCLREVPATSRTKRRGICATYRRHMKTRNTVPQVAACEANLHSCDEPCWYTGVLCDASGHVVELTLEEESMQCEFSQISLTYMASLRSLQILASNLVGEVNWPMIWSLPNLKRLDISRNKLVGNVWCPPPARSGVHHIKTNLKELVLDSNRFDGAVYGCLLVLNMTDIILSNNRFQTFPLAIEKESSLQRLVLSRNRLTTHIPPMIGNLANLNVLKIDHNYFSHGLPHELFMPSLMILNASYNLLTGGIPSAVSSSTKLRVLDLTGNGNMVHRLVIAGMSAELEELRISLTQLGGEMPQDWSDKQKLKVLDARGTGLYGSLPESLMSLPNLMILDLRENRLEKSLPALPLGQNSNMMQFQLAGNNLTGLIPQTYANFLAFQSNASTNIPGIFNVSHTSLSGEVPPFLWPEKVPKTTAVSLSPSRLLCTPGGPDLHEFGLDCAMQSTLDNGYATVASEAEPSAAEPQDAAAEPSEVSSGVVRQQSQPQAPQQLQQQSQQEGVQMQYQQRQGRHRLSGGGIAGITIAVILVVGLVAVLAVLSKLHKIKRPRIPFNRLYSTT